MFLMVNVRRALVENYLHVDIQMHALKFCLIGKLGHPVNNVVLGDRFSTGK